MAGVDLYDQMLESYSYPHKVQKWYHAIFHNIMETALVNGYIVYRESHEEADKIFSAVNFQKSVIDGLLENFDRKTIQQCTHVPNKSCRRTASSPAGYILYCNIFIIKPYNIGHTDLDVFVCKSFCHIDIIIQV